MSCPTHPGAVRWWSSFGALVSGGLFLAIPKCPICLAAWMGVLGVAGMGALHGWLRIGLAGAFVVAVGAFAVNARCTIQGMRATRRRALKQCSTLASK